MTGLLRPETQTVAVSVAAPGGRRTWWQRLAVLATGVGFYLLELHTLVRTEKHQLLPIAAFTTPDSVRRGGR